MKKSLMMFRTPLDQSQETDSMEVNSDRKKNSRPSVQIVRQGPVFRIEC